MKPVALPVSVSVDPWTTEIEAGVMVREMSGWLGEELPPQLVHSQIVTIGENGASS